MPKIRPLKDISQKYITVTPARAPQYQAGVTNPLDDWQEGALGGDPAFQSGVTDAIARDARPAGIRLTGTPGWKGPTLQKGVQRWPQGVRFGGSKYERNFGPFREVIERTELPPRGPKGDPNNIERVRVMAEALRAAKLAQK